VRPFPVCALFFALLPVPPASSQTASSAPGQERQLVIELQIPASPAQVWNAFATSEGLSTWLAPNTTVDLRPGGDWLVHFPGGSTGGGTIISFIPQKELVLSALAPDQTFVKKVATNRYVELRTLNERDTRDTRYNNTPRSRR